MNGRLRTELLKQEHFSGIQRARTAVRGWVFQYNYERTHQGLGGLLVPADRFHGLTDPVVSRVGETLDLSDGHWYSSANIERSIINLTADSEGNVNLYLLGRPITLR